MWRQLIPVRLGLTIFGVEIISNNDVIDPTSPTAQKLAERANLHVQNETGWDRLKSIFETDEFNSISPELDNVLSAATTGLFAGMFIGGIPASKIEYDDFISRNKAATFENHFEAKRKLQFSVTKAMAQGGWRVGWRLALFTGAFTFFTTAVSTYRNKSSVFEYSAGGLLAGSMYKLPMGPKAMISGGFAGGAIGTVAGVLTVGIMKLSGTTAEDLRYWKKGWKESVNREVMTESPQRKEALGKLGIAHDLELAMKANLQSTNKENRENEDSNKDLKEQNALPIKSETSSS
uniref:Complex I assembly factor TIMMDC1, mitochondrial n=1 Tax=Daphnia similis TaxID=35528 RepID=A0A4Y7LTU6_9CRUS|nr:EOG090X0FS6 [Daphnia similis]SVE72004.1 EOG090X0FS6 [Daphnia similis]SVE72631.1 EOG090X0FS6 [Daphnia similis]